MKNTRFSLTTKSPQSQAKNLNAALYTKTAAYKTQKLTQLSQTKQESEQTKTKEIEKQIIEEKEEEEEEEESIEFEIDEEELEEFDGKSYEELFNIYQNENDKYQQNIQLVASIIADKLSSA